MKANPWEVVWNGCGVGATILLGVGGFMEAGEATEPGSTTPMGLSPLDEEVDFSSPSVDGM